ncbi:MAG: hypothetical protein JRC54_07300 [Deltaproteobacteria bacterium]|nr:hypothetical protein [Deltaproteobacteria bacterium]
MYHPSKEEFLSLAQQGNIIPVFREVTAFIGHRPRLLVKARGDEIELSRNGKQCGQFKASPLEYLKNLMETFRAVPVEGLPRFFGGLVGYLSYDTVRFIEDLPTHKPDDVGMPDAAFMIA